MSIESFSRRLLRTQWQCGLWREPPDRLPCQSETCQELRRAGRV